VADPNAKPDADPAAELLAEADRAMSGARAALADLATAGPLAALANARTLAASLDRAAEDPDVAGRIKHATFHLAGLLDALGVLPRAAAGIAGRALADYAAEPPAEG
jgi:F0F1-type ATP synthase membrane subunit c/vacuolar-type H+-ATPase subunit K